MAQSGLNFDGDLGYEAGVILGTAGGGVNTWDDSYRAVYAEGKNRVHPFVVPQLMHNAAASHLSMEFNLQGPELHRRHRLRQFQPCDGAGVPDDPRRGRPR